jgi:hypothetical protein
MTNGADLAISLLEASILVLPLWLASVRYTIDGDDSEVNVEHGVSYITLGFLGILVISVTSGKYLLSRGSEWPTTPIYSVWFFLSVVGLAGLSLMTEVDNSWLERVHLTMGKALLGAILLTAVLILWIEM